MALRNGHLAAILHFNVTSVRLYILLHLCKTYEVRIMYPHKVMLSQGQLIFLQRFAGHMRGLVFEVDIGVRSFGFTTHYLLNFRVNNTVRRVQAYTCSNGRSVAFKEVLQSLAFIF